MIYFPFLSFRSVFPEPIKFSKLLLTITGVSGNNSEFIISKGGNEKDTEVDSLLFQPDIVKQFSYKFTPPFSDVGTEIKVRRFFSFSLIIFIVNR